MVMTRAHGPLVHTSGWFTTSPQELATPVPPPARVVKVVRRPKATDKPVQKPVATPVAELGRLLARAWNGQS